MTLFYKLTALAVCVALLLSLASCADFGVGESEEDVKKYFSGVYVLTQHGAEKYPIEVFNRDVNLEDMEIKEVVLHEEYCYIGFRVSEGYTVSISEFAFFAKTMSEEGKLDLEFYVVDEMPTSIKGDDGSDVEIPPLDGETPPPPEEGSEGEGEGEGEGEETAVREDELFTPLNQFHTHTFSIGQEWESVLLQFDGTQTVEAGQYVVVRVNNNCYTSSEEGEEAQTPPVSFTFNYLLFHFTDAHKK